MANGFLSNFLIFIQCHRNCDGMNRLFGSAVKVSSQFASTMNLISSTCVHAGAHWNSESGTISL